MDRVGGGQEDGAGSADLISFPLSFYFVRGDSYPETCAQRIAEGDGSPLLWPEARPTAGFFCATYPLGMDGFQRDINKNKVRCPKVYLCAYVNL
jgi:hypothetical protein